MSSQLGREILTRELKRRRLEAPSAEAMHQAGITLNLMDGTALEFSLGRGDLAIGQVMRALFPDVAPDACQENYATIFGRVVDLFRLGRGVTIQGVDGLSIGYSECSQPAAGV